MAQRTVSGTVTSAEDGSAVPGVNVVLKGTTTGTTTDLDGNYRLSVPEEGGTLVFSFIGLTPQEVAIGARSVIDVGMESDVTELAEVVVTAFGIERQEKSLTYATQEVNGEKFTQAREANVVNSLSGQIAGVQVTNSNGAPGASSRIVLRGASTISGSNQPLFVVDGIPINNSNYGNGNAFGGFDSPNGAGDINPDDIASISVLKGPVAAALYGNRAANGVILITTKTGKGTKGLGISVNSSTTFDSPFRLPAFQNSYGQGASNSFFEFVDGQNGSAATDESWGMPLDAGLNAVQWNNYQSDGTTNGTTPWVSYPNNVRDFYQQGFTTNNGVAISGGDGTNAFRLSATNMTQKGIVPNTDFHRWNLNASGDLELTKGLNASFSANYIKGQADNLQSVGYSANNPVLQMIWSGRNVDLNGLKDYNNLPLAGPNTQAAGTPLNWNTLFENNPFWTQHTNLNGYDKDRLIGNAKITYKITDWLSAFVRSGMDTWSQRNGINKAIGTNEAVNGSFQELDRRFQEINNFFLVTADKTFGDFSGSISFGGNQMIQNYTNISGFIPGLEIPGVYNLSNIKSGNSPTLQNTIRDQRINSLLGNGRFSYREFVYLELSARNDWWSVLPTNNNSYFYPAASISFVLTDMFDFSSFTLPYLKVRAGWSKVGSAGGLSPYSTQQVFRFSQPAFGSVPRLYNPGTLNNPNIKPETTTGIEFGLSTKFFNGRISMDATYYDQTSSDLIVNVQTSSATGYTNAYNNVGEINNKGVELQLTSKIIDKKDFNFGINVNFASYNNRVVSVNNNGINNDKDDAINLTDPNSGTSGQWNVSLQAREGYKYGVLYGPAYLKDSEGNIVHKNGLPQYDPNYKVLGWYQPNWTGGVTFNVAYKGLSLSALVDAKWGGSMYSMTTTWGRYSGVLNETLKGRDVGIIGKGVMQVGTDADGNPTYAPNDVVVPAENYNKIAYSNSIAEGSVFDASYVKLRQLTLNYKLPDSWFGGTPFKNVNVALVGRNLALLYSKIPHVDPESAFSNADSSQGIEFGQIPSLRSLGFNINFKL